MNYPDCSGGVPERVDGPQPKKVSHQLLKHPTSGKEVWVTVHTRKDAGRLGNHILREAGVE
jgi:hypothetical protein